MLRLAFDFIITWRETRTRPNAYKTSINYFIMKRRQVILYPCLPEAFLSELCLPCPCLL